jgi:hypothetical protein
MHMQWAEIWPFRKQQSLEKAPIDMGNGRVITAEDVVEGHFHRLATTTVQVQVNENLQAAITVVAPKVAPLTELANEVAQAVPVAQPAPQFRHDLQKALELTHRQHTAQRKLGARPPQPQHHWGTSGVVIAGLLVVLGVLFYLQRRRQQAEPEQLL